MIDNGTKKINLVNIHELMGFIGILKTYLTEVESKLAQAENKFYYNGGKTARVDYENVRIKLKPLYENFNKKLTS